MASNELNVILTLTARAECRVSDIMLGCSYPQKQVVKI